MKKSIIFPTTHSLGRCRLLALILMISISVPLLYQQYSALQLIMRIIFGAFMIHVSSLVMALIMLSFSKYFLRQLKKCIDVGFETTVTVLPLNKLQRYQYKLLGATSRFATDERGKIYRVVYLDRFDESFDASLYCLQSLGPFKFYTAVTSCA